MGGIVNGRYRAPGDPDPAAFLLACHAAAAPAKQAGSALSMCAESGDSPSPVCWHSAMPAVHGCTLERLDGGRVGRVWIHGAPSLESWGVLRVDNG